MRRAVIEDDGDLVGLGDDVVVGDHDAGGIDDEAGAERIDAARRRALALRLALAAAVEEVAEQFVELRIVRHLRLLAAARTDVLRGRDIDHRVDHLLGDVGDRFRSARQRRDGQRRQHDGDGSRSQCRLAGLPGEPADNAEHGRVNSSGM